jgi:hypothetical protein
VSRRDGTRLRWWLWRRLVKLPNVCTANAHSRIIGRYRDRKVRVDDVCRSDLARNGACWCGKLRNPQSEG